MDSTPYPNHEIDVKVDAMTLKYTPTVVFGVGNLNWQPTVEYNVVFLRAAQNYLNDLYKRRGHLFLNEVYQQLGLPITGAGQVLGWIFGEGEDLLLDFEIAGEPRSDGEFYITINPLGIIVDHIDAR